MGEILSKSLLSHLRLAATPASEIAAELDEQFAFHIDVERDRLIQGGCSAEAAQEQAEQAFGDAERHRADCLAAALRRRKRIMIELLAVSGILTTSVVALTGWMAWEAWSNAARNRTLAGQVAALQNQVAASRVPSDLPMAQAVYFVSIRGAVKRPSVWTFEKDNAITLRQLLSKVGGMLPEAQGDITLTRRIDGKESEVTHLTSKQITGASGPDPVLLGFCTVEVR